jgi:dTMP kinase
VTEQTARGAFIVFEGIDGSGKSTQARLLAARLQDAGVPVHQTAEPTNGPVGTLIRNGFNRRVDLDDRVIASLFVADRLDHITNAHDGMLGIVERGTTVLCDRYHLSSQAYQASDVGSDWIASSNSISTELMLPDLTIYLDAPRRIGSRSTNASGPRANATPRRSPPPPRSSSRSTPTARRTSSPTPSGTRCRRGSTSGRWRVRGADTAPPRGSSLLGARETSRRAARFRT